MATETSGRGLGMDIVRRIVVSDLGGELTMTSEPGTGTTFTLDVPLTIAIIDVFSFECAQQAFVVPVATIEEIFDLGDLRRISSPTDGPGRIPLTLCERRGKTLPIVSLGKLLRIDGGANAKCRRRKRARAFLRLEPGGPTAAALSRAPAPGSPPARADMSG